MFWFSRFFLKMDEAGDKGGGGGSGGDKGGSNNNAGGDKGDKGGSGNTITLTKEQYDEIMSRLPAKADPGDKGGKKDDETLADRARKEREESATRATDQRAMEEAITFIQGGKEWLKQNKSLLPDTIEGIFTQADKENFGSAVEKSNAIKVGVISEFFAQQANLDLLTPGLKSQLEEFLKLTKTVKQERAAQLYANVFEPAFAMLKGVKRAEQLQKGHSNPNDADAAYRDRMMKGSIKHYGVKEKNHA